MSLKLTSGDPLIKEEHITYSCIPDEDICILVEKDLVTFKTDVKFEKKIQLDEVDKLRAEVAEVNRINRELIVALDELNLCFTKFSLYNADEEDLVEGVEITAKALDRIQTQ